MFRFIDPDTTTTTTIAGVTFTVGFWPPRESERIAAGIAAIRNIAEQESAQAREGRLEVYRRMVQYGVRGWEGWEGAPAPNLEDEEIHGRKHKRLAARLLDGVSLSGALEALALACLQHNNLQKEESKSPTPSDPAPG